MSMEQKCSGGGSGWLAAAALAILLTGCSTGPSTGVPATPAAPAAAPPPVAGSSSPPQPAELPPVPAAGPVGVCPYLPSRAAADLNGQLVASVRLDPAYDPPACFFLIGDGSVQLSVWVFRAASSAQATAAVNRAAPIADSDPADEPSGWTGGRRGGPKGAVYAVAKDAVAVVVTTNQDQSIKAQRVTEGVIGTLGL